MNRKQRIQLLLSQLEALGYEAPDHSDLQHENEAQCIKIERLQAEQHKRDMAMVHELTNADWNLNYMLIRIDSLMLYAADADTGNALKNALSGYAISLRNYLNVFLSVCEKWQQNPLKLNDNRIRSAKYYLDMIQDFSAGKPGALDNLKDAAQKSAPDECEIAQNIEQERQQEKEGLAKLAAQAGFKVAERVQQEAERQKHAPRKSMEKSRRKKGLTKWGIQQTMTAYIPFKNNATGAASVLWSLLSQGRELLSADERKVFEYLSDSSDCQRPSTRMNGQASEALKEDIEPIEWEKITVRF